jgi:hypothetical protein
LEKNIKRSYNSKLKNKALSLLSLVGIGSHNPNVSTGIGIGGYSLYKKGIKNGPYGVLRKIFAGQGCRSFGKTHKIAQAKNSATKAQNGIS